MKRSDYSSVKAQKVVRTRLFQHPLILFPAALSVLALFGGLIDVAPALPAFLLTIASGTFAFFAKKNLFKRKEKDMVIAYHQELHRQFNHELNLRIEEIFYGRSKIKFKGLWEKVLKQVERLRDSYREARDTIGSADLVSSTALADIEETYSELLTAVEKLHDQLVTIRNLDALYLTRRLEEIQKVSKERNLTGQENTELRALQMKIKNVQIVERSVECVLAAIEEKMAHTSSMILTLTAPDPLDVDPLGSHLETTTEDFSLPSETISGQAPISD